MTFPDDVQEHIRQVPGLPGESADSVRMAQIEALYAEHVTTSGGRYHGDTYTSPAGVP